MFNPLLDQIRIEDAFSDAKGIPSKQDFTALAELFTGASYGDGVKLTPKQCQMLGIVFSALSVSDIKPGGM